MATTKELLLQFARALKAKITSEAPMIELPGTEYANGDTEIGFWGEQGIDPDWEVDPAWLDQQIDELCAHFSAKADKEEK